jgi:hypothetical protein
MLHNHKDFQWKNGIAECAICGETFPHYFETPIFQGIFSKNKFETWYNEQGLYRARNTTMTVQPFNWDGML